MGTVANLFCWSLVNCSMAHMLHRMCASSRSTIIVWVTEGCGERVAKWAIQKAYPAYSFSWVSCASGWHGSRERRAGRRGFHK